MSFKIGNNITLKISIRTMNNFQVENIYEKRKPSPKKNVIEGPISFKDRIKMFSGGYKALTTRDNYNISKSVRLQKKSEITNEIKEENNQNKNEKKTTHHLTTIENKNNEQPKNPEKYTPKEETDKKNQTQIIEKTEQKDNKDGSSKNMPNV